MIRKYHNHKLQTNPRHREEEPPESIVVVCLIQRSLEKLTSEMGLEYFQF